MFSISLYWNLSSTQYPGFNAGHVNIWPSLVFNKTVHVCVSLCNKSCVPTANGNFLICLILLSYMEKGDNIAPI